MAVPDVSIIVPCFNGARYIQGLAMTLSKLLGEAREVIFVDDGSTDNSAEMFSALMPTARVIGQPNSGVAAARNTGAAAAAGEFLQFLDADDVILPGKLAAQVAAARSHGCDVVYSDWRMVTVRSDEVVCEPVCSDPMPCEPVAALLAGWWAPPHAYLVRRQSYHKVGGSNTRLVNAQDFDLFLRLAIGGCVFERVPGHYADYCRYVDVASLARGPRTQYYSDYEAAVESAVSQLEGQGHLTCARRRAAALKLHAIARSVYSIDRPWFRRVTSRIHELDSNFKAPGPTLYRLAATALGLSISEAMASWARSVPPIQWAKGQVSRWRRP